MNKEVKIFKSKYKGYCFECYGTIWKGEMVRSTGKIRHLNCIKSLTDETPRIINPVYCHRLGTKVCKKDMVKLMKYKNSKKKK